MTDEIKILQNNAYTQIIAAGGETELDFTFPIFDAAHLKVEDVDGDGVATELTYLVDYEVSGVGQEAGGSITLSDTTYPGGAIQGHKYNLILNVPAERATDFNERGDFKASVLNRELDLLAQISQCIARDAKQSVKAPLGENPDTVMADIHEARNVATAKAAEASESATAAAASTAAASGSATAAAASAAQAEEAKDGILEDEGIIAISTDLALGDNSKIKKLGAELLEGDDIGIVASNIGELNNISDNLDSILGVGQNAKTVKLVCLKNGAPASLAYKVKLISDNYLKKSHHPYGYVAASGLQDAWVPDNTAIYDDRFLALQISTQHIPSDWFANRVCVKGEAVMRNGVMYQCETSNTQSVFTEVEAAPPAWASGTQYNSGGKATEGGVAYRCRIGHISGDYFATEEPDYPNWIGGNYYPALSKITRDGVSYMAVRDIPPSDTFSTIESYDAWESGVFCFVGKLVTNNNIYYRCQVPHLTGSSFNLYEPYTNWETSRWFAKGDMVYQNSRYYRASEGHTSGAFADDLAAGKWYESYLRQFWKEDIVRQQWVITNKEKIWARYEPTVYWRVMHDEWVYEGTSVSITYANGVMYYNTSDKHIYKKVDGAWVDQGAPDDNTLYYDQSQGLIYVRDGNDLKRIY